MKRERHDAVSRPKNKHARLQMQKTLQADGVPRKRALQVLSTVPTDGLKKRKTSIVNMFKSLKVEEKWEDNNSGKTSLILPGFSAPKISDYNNTFELHSNNFRMFFLQLQGFLTGATHDVLASINTKWMTLVEPIRTHLRLETLHGLHEMAQLKQFHRDLLLAEAAAAALKDEATKWEAELHESTIQIGFILETLK